jgi:hypothetical protein
MMPPDQLRCADTVTAPLFILLGLLVVRAGIDMPMSGTYGGRPIAWYTSPGLFPIVIGALLSSISTAIFLRAVVRGGANRLPQHVAAALVDGVASRQSRRAAFVVSCLGIYVALLSFNPFGDLATILEREPRFYGPATRFLLEPDGVNYLVSTMLFLVVLLLAFHRPRRPISLARRALFVMVFSVVLSWGVAFTFTELLYSPLP